MILHLFSQCQVHGPSKMPHRVATLSSKAVAKVTASFNSQRVNKILILKYNFLK